MNVRFPDDPALGASARGEELASRLDAKGAALVTPEVLGTPAGHRELRSRPRTAGGRPRGDPQQPALAGPPHPGAGGHEPPSKSNSLRHDQLIIEAITTTALLTETLIREGKSQPTLLDRRTHPSRFPTSWTRSSIRLARLEWQRATFSPDGS